jgi:phosphoserine phosphatase
MLRRVVWNLIPVVLVLGALDKTYLETDFSSIRGIVRSATEPAHAKRTVPGAAALVRALGAKPEVRIAILSGSPTQLRDVLEEKLHLDGVRFDSLTLKDNLGNLRRGRLRAIKGQLGYKLPALLQARRDTEAGTTETLFGDADLPLRGPRPPCGAGPFLVAGGAGPR